jgi:hypothetical protein
MKANLLGPEALRKFKKLILSDSTLCLWCLFANIIMCWIEHCSDLLQKFFSTLFQHMKLFFWPIWLIRLFCLIWLVLFFAKSFSLTGTCCDVALLNFWLSIFITSNRYLNRRSNFGIDNQKLRSTVSISF